MITIPAVPHPRCPATRLCNTLKSRYATSFESEPAVVRASGARLWLAFFILILCGYLAGYNVGKVSAALPHIRADLDISLFLAGSVASSYSMAAMLLAVVIGLFVSSVGAVSGVFIGLVLTGFAGAIGATAGSYAQLISGRVAEGIGYILLAISIPVLIAKVTSEQSRPVAMGIWGTFMPGGVALSMLVALIVQNGWVEQWRPLWWFTCLLAVACVALMVLFVLPVLKSIDSSTATSAAAVSKPALYASVAERDPLLLAVSFMLYSMFFVTLVTYLPSVLAETSDVQLQAATRITVFAALFNIAGNLLGGWLIGTGVRLKTLLTTALIGASLFASAVFLEELSVEIRIVCGLLACLSGGILPASVFASISGFVPVKKAGLLLGVVFQALGTGQVAGPVLLAVLVEQTGNWRWGSVYFICLGFVSAVVLGFFQRQKSKA